jgi:hypothetical protein
MTKPVPRTSGDNSLIDLLDRLVETGVVATGDVLLGLADVDLIRVNLQLVLGAVDTLLSDDGELPPVRPRGDATPPSDATPRSDTTPRSHATPRGESAVPAQPDRQPTPHAAPATPTVSTPPTGTVPSSGAVPALRLDPPPDRSDLGVGGLLVAVLEIVHQLLERQAIHRMERGSLTSDQIERLGQALMALDQRMNQLIEIFSSHSAPALPAPMPAH